MSAGEWHDACPAERIAEGELRGQMLAGARLCIGRTSRGAFAIHDTCPHAGGSLSEGMLDGDEVVCPLHAWGFDTRSGDCAEDPSCKVRVFETRIENGILQVKL